jgi:hypothetical protein
MSDFDNLTIKEQEEKIIEWLAHFYNVDKDVIETSYQEVWLGENFICILWRVNNLKEQNDI